MFIRPVGALEVLNIVKNSKNKMSTDFNNVNMSIIKIVIDDIVEPFAFICNKSFETNIFPNEMKIAKVVPIYKGGDKTIFTNYRPISLLSQLSKILEKLFMNRLDKFIDKCNILNKGQYGFCTNMSTSFALIELVEEITKSTDNKQGTIGVFIDFERAFDTIGHNLLI